MPITDHFGVRLDLRAFVTVLDTDGDIFCVSSGGATCAHPREVGHVPAVLGALGVTVGF